MNGLFAKHQITVEECAPIKAHLLHRAGLTEAYRHSLQTPSDAIIRGCPHTPLYTPRACEGLTPPSENRGLTFSHRRKKENPEGLFGETAITAITNKKTTASDEGQLSTR